MPALAILLVEDNPDDAELLLRELGHAGLGWRIEQERTVRAAVARLSDPAHGLDAVLLDLRLPDSKGPPTVASVRQAAGDLPIVVLTGGEGQDEIVEGGQALQHGADDYLVKGSRLTVSAVERAVTYAVERRRAARRLEASEARCRQLVEAATDIIYQSDPAGRFTFVNPVAVRIMGYREDELLGMHFADLVRPDHQARVLAHYDAQFRERTPSTQLEFVALAKGGREIWIEQNVQTVLEAGHIVAFQAVARDVSDRKAHEREREQLIAQLQTALGQVRTLSDFLPLCASCRKIKDDEDGSWHDLEQYLAKKALGTRVTHGICPECKRAIYPQLKKNRPRGGA
jgi:PAS domain S-box-containing protein